MPSDLQITNIKDQANANSAITIASDGQITVAQNNPTITLGSNATLGSGVSLANATFPTGSITKYEHASSTVSSQLASTTVTDVSGTSMTYTPATSASKVFYQTVFALAVEDARHIAHFRINHDGSDVDSVRSTDDSSGSSYYHTKLLTISHTFSAWSGAKTTKVRWREYTDLYTSRLHRIGFWDGVSSASLSFDVHTFMYSIM